jgi:glycosyltransferase involved in cell wall biosynthesis
MKILFIKEKRSPTGIEGIGNYLINVCEVLNRLNIKFLVLYNSDDKLLKKMSEKNINVRIVDIPPYSSKRMFEFKKNREFKLLINDIIKNENITHISIQWPYLLNFLSSSLSIPIISHWQGAFKDNQRYPFFHWKDIFYPKKIINSFYARQYGFNLKKADLVICPGIASKQTANICFDTPHSKIAINKNGIKAPDTDAHLNLKKELGFKDNDRVILSVGRVTKSKGAEDFCRVADLFRDKDEFKFVFVGDYRDKLFSDYLKSKYGNLVTFTGQKTNIYDYYKTADLFLFLSHREGGPLVLAEAMFFSLPIVAWDVIGVNEMVINNKNGNLVRLGDYTSVKNNISKILDDKKIYTSYSKISLEESSKYTIEKSVEGILNLYENFKTIS